MISDGYSHHGIDVALLSVVFMMRNRIMPRKDNIFFFTHCPFSGEASYNFDQWKSSFRKIRSQIFAFIDQIRQMIYSGLQNKTVRGIDYETFLPRNGRRITNHDNNKTRNTYAQQRNTDDEPPCRIVPVSNAILTLLATLTSPTSPQQNRLYCEIWSQTIIFKWKIKAQPSYPWPIRGT